MTMPSCVAAPLGTVEVHGFVILETDLLPEERDLAILREKLKTLFTFSLFGRKPELPAAGRWTGVPGAASWFGRLLHFPTLMKKLLSGGKSKKTAAVDEDQEDTIIALATDAAALIDLRGKRVTSFIAWTDQPHARALLQCYLLVRQNGPVRHILHFIFKYEGKSGMPPSAEEMDSIARRYMLDLDGDIRTPFDAPYLEWCSGKLVRQCLRSLTESLDADSDFYKDCNIPIRPPCV